ncbi:MAG: hypothetical protein RR873_05540, partial [Christensenella sp.]
DVRYRTVTKGAGEHAFKLMAFSGHKSVWLPHAIDIDPDITKADKSSQFGWRTNPITTASVKQVTDSDNLYVN